jgi:predicted nucleic acid-binding protein
MNGKPFLDSNILIYTVSGDDRRKALAGELTAGGGIISVQVLNEFVNVARKKLRRSWPDIEAALAQFRIVLDPPLPLTMVTHESGVRLARRYRLSFYDSLIVASAMEARCDLLLSEDMADGTTIGGVTIHNPFRA